MNVNGTPRVKVEPGGAGVAAHVGLHSLGAFADHLGLGDSLPVRIASTGERLPAHDGARCSSRWPWRSPGESCAQGPGDLGHRRLVGRGRLRAQKGGRPQVQGRLRLLGRVPGYAASLAFFPVKAVTANRGAA